MSHTPGEWTYDADQLWTDEHNAIVKESMPDYQNAYPVILVRSGGFFVADCGCNEYTEANARLIAAAPEMYTALRSARDNLALIVDEGLVLEYYDFTEIDAAIAKARGSE